MNFPIVHILASPTANLASVCAAVRRCGAQPVLTDAPNDAATAARLILPGVGSFGAAMAWLADSKLATPLTDRIRRGYPTLGICLGMQVLFESSEESPGIRGLGVIPGAITRFEATSAIRVPQLGWNRVRPSPGFTAAPEGFAYYANSFRAGEAARCTTDWSLALSDYGGTFIAAIQSCRHPAVLGCQFHPELSGDWGLGLLRAWMTCIPAALSPEQPTQC